MKFELSDTLCIDNLWRGTLRCFLALRFSSRFAAFFHRLSADGTFYVFNLKKSKKQRPERNAAAARILLFDLFRLFTRHGWKLFFTSNQTAQKQSAAEMWSKCLMKLVILFDYIFILVCCVDWIDKAENQKVFTRYQNVGGAWSFLRLFTYPSRQRLYLILAEG